jgi:ABC-type antimicrobial peptide transport system permease subunit
MILFNSFLYVLPSIIVGFGASIPLLMYLYRKMFKESYSDFGLLPDTDAIVQAIGMGLLIPFLASIIPIYNAL